MILANTKLKKRLTSVGVCQLLHNCSDILDLERQRQRVLLDSPNLVECVAAFSQKQVLKF